LNATDNGPIVVVALDSDRTVLLRHLTVGDEGFLQALVNEDSDSHAFTLGLLKHQEVDTSPTRSEELRADEQAGVAFAWAAMDQSFEALEASTVPASEAFKTAVVRHVREWQESRRRFAAKHFPDVGLHRAKLLENRLHLTPRFLDTAAAAVGRLSGHWTAIRDAYERTSRQRGLCQLITEPQLIGSLAALAERAQILNSAMVPVLANMQRITRLLDSPPYALDIFRRLPAAGAVVASWRATRERIDQGEETLRAAGLGFAVSLVEPSLLADLASAPACLKGAQATNRLLQLTRSDGFRGALEERVTISDVTARRWGVLKAALAAHKERDYVLAIPTLFAQVEGLFTDSMILKGLATTRDGKVLALRPDGTMKRNRHGDPVVLTGLGQKVLHSPYQNHETLQEITAALVEHLTRRRNGVLHGSDLCYAKAKLSTQLVLVTLIVTTAILEFERGAITR
jgi:hypothetical protein